MNRLCFPLFILFSHPAFAQIADSSFFPSVRSINPGVAHQREQSLISVDVTKKVVEKNHAFVGFNIVGGIQTDVELQKNTAFYAGKLGFMGFEVLVDQESGDKIEHINSTTYGVRDVTNEATSTYAGFIIDAKFIGISYAAANYQIGYKFRAGDPPNVSAKDIDTSIDYSLIKVGSAFNIKGFTFGAYGSEKNSEETYKYTYYDPTSGAQGTTERWPATTKSTGYGAGFGYTSKTFRVELAYEGMSKADLDEEEDPQNIINAAPASSRATVAGEIRLGKISLGARVRNNVGNFTDLEDLISSNLLYSEMDEDDSRLETSFNFGFGSSQGFSFSAIYTQSETKTKEVSRVFADPEKFPATTKSTAYGVNVSYYF